MLKTQRSHSDKGAFVHSDSLMLGEEASSDRLNLYYEQMCRQLEKKNSIHNLKPVKASKIEFQRAKTDLMSLPKSAQSRASFHPESNLTSRPTSNIRSTIRLPSSRNPLLIAPPIVRPKKNTSIRYSAREKLVIDWAFKKFDADLKTEKKMPKKKHEIWFETDEDILEGAECNKHIDLNEYEDAQGDSDFYRKHRNNAATAKTDIARNRYSQQLDFGLMDLARKRFKVLALMDYQKKTFVQNQLRKSNEMPGLRSPMLLAQDPTFKFKRVYKNSNLELTNNLENEDAEVLLTDRSLKNNNPGEKTVTIQEPDTKGLTLQKAKSDLQISADPKLNQLALKAVKQEVTIIDQLLASSDGHEKPPEFRREKTINVIDRRLSRVAEDIKFNVKKACTDNRFNNLITLVNKNYEIREGQKDVNKIIELNPALRRTEKEIEEEELLQLRKVRSVTSAIVRKAREAISSREYTFWKL